MSGFGGFGPAQGIIATAVVDNGTPVAGGTANGVLYVNSSGNLDSGSVLSFNGTNLSMASGQILFADGTSSLPGLALGSDTDRGFAASGSTGITFASGNANQFLMYTSGIRLGSTKELQWGDNANPASGTTDVVLLRDAAGILAQRNGTNAQTFRVYGRYVSATNFNTVSIAHSVVNVTASGATSVATNVIPAKVIIIGVSTTVTTTLTGASGYTVGDGSDADRWGDVTGTAVGTDTDYNDYTAAPIPAWNAAAQSITLTAKTSNFTGGVISVDVAYIVSEAD